MDVDNLVSHPLAYLIRFVKDKKGASEVDPSEVHLSFSFATHFVSNLYIVRTYMRI